MVEGRNESGVTLGGLILEAESAISVGTISEPALDARVLAFRDFLIIRDRI